MSTAESSSVRDESVDIIHNETVQWAENTITTYYSRSLWHRGLKDFTRIICSCLCVNGVLLVAIWCIMQWIAINEYKAGYMHYGTCIITNCDKTEICKYKHHDFYYKFMECWDDCDDEHNPQHYTYIQATKGYTEYGKIDVCDNNNNHNYSWTLDVEDDYYTLGQHTKCITNNQCDYIYLNDDHLNAEIDPTAYIIASCLCPLVWLICFCFIIRYLVVWLNNDGKYGHDTHPKGFWIRICDMISGNDKEKWVKQEIWDEMNDKTKVEYYINYHLGNYQLQQEIKQHRYFEIEIRNLIVRYIGMIKCKSPKNNNEQNKKEMQMAIR